MDITPHVEALRQDLTRAAEVGGIEVEVAAERLLAALDPALRLALMDVLSQAAAEISEQLPGVAIDVRLKGREPEFAVSGAPAAQSQPADEPFDATDDGEAVARITLRLPEAVKTRAEALAASRGQSLNTWLVAAARAAASQDGSRDRFRDDHRHGAGHYGRAGKHIRGWAK
jgi:predicted HicB family RNase H-like nuclease